MIEADKAILAKLESIIETELEEAERRIRERQNDVLIREMEEARNHIRKKFIDFIVSLHKVAKIMAEEEEASKRFYTFIPAGKGDRKTLEEIVSEHRELEESGKT